MQSIVSQSLKLSVYSEISMVTLGDGDQLFEAFGHSAIRVKDPLLRLDLIYNYGEFDFNQPNFYTNFAKGRLIYKLGRRPFQLFLNSYRRQERWAKQQVLDLTQEEKQQFFEFLEQNALPQNASYAYDPFFNSCATKLRDVTKEVLGDKVMFHDTYSNKNHTLRRLMNEELPWNTWGSFGINVALGSKLDQQIDASHYLYLPDYVYTAFQSATKLVDGKTIPLVKSESTLLKFDEKSTAIEWYNPLVVFILVLLLISAITFYDMKRRKRSQWLDFSLFLITGIVGGLLVFLWFFTDHQTTPNNWNILWAFAPNLLVVFFLVRKKFPQWLKKYLGILILCLFAVPVLWILGIQLFAISLIPLLVGLCIRYIYLYRLLSLEK